jgi:hypothetical protein
MHTVENEYPKVTITRKGADGVTQKHVCYGPACAEFYLTLGSGGAGFANGLCITIESTPPARPPSRIRTPAEALNLEAMLWDSIYEWENDFDTWD